MERKKPARGRTLLLSLSFAMALNHAAGGAGNSTANDAAPAPVPETSAKAANTLKIRINIEDRVITATLVDTATSRDFVSLLPITLQLDDYAATEKISYLPTKLSTEAAPSGSDPAVGDIAYYAPWGNLGIFYKDFRYSSGLIKLGKIDSGVEALNVPDGRERPSSSSRRSDKRPR